MCNHPLLGATRGSTMPSYAYVFAAASLAIGAAQVPGVLRDRGLGAASSPRGLLAGCGAVAGVGARGFKRLAAMLAGALDYASDHSPTFLSGTLVSGSAGRAADDDFRHLAIERQGDGARADMTRDCIAEVVEDGEAVEFIDARLARETDRAVQIACPPVVMIHIAERDPEGGLAVREASEAMLALHPLLIKRGQKVSKLKAVTLTASRRPRE